MNLIVGSPLWLTIPLLLLLAAAAIEDGVRLRISNVTCGLVFLGALIAMAVHGFEWSLWQNFLVCVVILAVGTVAFATGAMGGGDVKLLAALGLWFSLKAAIALIAAVFIAGGLLAILSLSARRIGLRSDPNPRKGRIPYGIAIAAGASFILGTQLNDRPSTAYVDHIRALRAQNR
jgi:prepilin peptidase CpaA